MNKTAVSIVVAVSLGAGVFLGYVYGKQAALISARNEVKNVLDLAYPPPPGEIKTASGRIANLADSAFDLAIDDPADYLPHSDGSPRKKLTLRVNVPKETEVGFTDYSSFDKNGNPAQKKIIFNDLRSGDVVAVTVGENIRKTRSVTATKVELVKY